MTDPTYDKSKINANPVWKIAFVLSECKNDSAPIGWGNWIWVAEAVIKAQNDKAKKRKKVSFNNLTPL